MAKSIKWKWSINTNWWNGIIWWNAWEVKIITEDFENWLKIQAEGWKSNLDEILYKLYNQINLTDLENKDIRINKIESWRKNGIWKLKESLIDFYNNHKEKIHFSWSISSVLSLVESIISSL